MPAPVLTRVLAWADHSAGLRYGLILMVALAVMLPGLAALPVTDRDEARFAQASRQMIETGDPIDIRFQDQPRWKKPIGIYWLQAAAVRATGGTGIWAYRLPSALAMIAAALATAWAARPLIGPRGALYAGLILATALMAVVEGHIAKTDAVLCLTGVLALGALGRLVLPGASDGAGAAAVFWGAIAAAILVKGPVVPVIALGCLGWLWVAQRARPPLGRLRPVPGLLACAALVAPWAIAIGIVSQGQFYAASLGNDLGAKLASGQEAHWGPPGLYLALVWATLWPWAALIPLAAPWVWQHRREGWLRLVAGWVLPFWLLLEVVPTKLPHYVLPLYPALAIVLGAWLAARPAITGGTRAAAALIAVPGGVLALACIGLPWWLEGRPVWPATALALAGAACCVMAARAALRRETGALVAASLVAAATLYPAALQFAVPQLGTVFPSPRIAALAAPWRACASGPLISVGYREPSLVFLTETGTWAAGPEAAGAALAADPGRMALVEDRLRPAFDAALGPVPLIERGSLRYFNLNRGKWEVARLLTPASGPWTPCRPG